MELIDILKTLGNDYRLQMLQWLKEPALHFSAEHLASTEKAFTGGVCVGAIATKSGLAQSVVSGYLNSLKQTGLVETKRIGKWTYYRYNAPAVAEFLSQLEQQI
ncbi:ArsR/SmtB family transcription factor [Basilea psittacipulmonis]|uniref:ArsR family transcriptional regulator n=1 Tax=Basilea psittacipulmonis DSM 24701 TaxID=1072685 RepID=A0A077DDA2_9BURK|nr:helix-turn-helix transcriptional regulator [Basilea psittacipulmonis]AIL32584.1 ArsR family transcriptional regulator [Basilea psittacipulmonis DSM 24701]